MCGRITQKSDPRVLSLGIATLIEPLTEPPGPRFNGAPGQEHWVIRQHPKTRERHLDRLWWGLIPNWIKDASPRHKPISAVKTAKLKEPGRYGDGGNLWLQVTDTGRKDDDGAPIVTKSWIFRFKLNGKSRAMGLGPVELVSLADARERARDARKLLLDGKDPIEEREKARKADQEQKRIEAARSVTFKFCAERYIAAHESGWKNKKHRGQWKSTLETYAYPEIGDLPVSSVDIALMVRVLEPIWDTKRETADRVRGRIEAVLDWARVKHYRQGDNPARWSGLLEYCFVEKSKVSTRHHPAMSYKDVPAFVGELRARNGISAKALEFTILTAARTPGRWPRVPAKPTPTQMKAAAAALWKPFAEFPFVDDAARGVHLATLLAATIRQTLPLAPGTSYDAPAPGTGKTLLGQCVQAMCGMDGEAIPECRDEEELRKRLLSSLRGGKPVLLLDNIRGSFGSSSLEAMLTSPIYTDRVLGSSQMLSLPVSAMVLISGNNFQPSGDLWRRLLTCRIDAKSEAPERRSFDLNPFAFCTDNRQEMVAAALTLLRGFVANGSPRATTDRLASYEEWDVRRDRRPPHRANVLP